MAKHKKPIKKKEQLIKAAKQASAARQTTCDPEPALKPLRADASKTEPARHEAPKPSQPAPKAASDADPEGKVAVPTGSKLTVAKAPPRAAAHLAAAANQSDLSDSSAAFGSGSTHSSANEASQTFQTFLADMRQMASETIEQTTGAMEQLRNATSMEEMVSLQTAFMQQTFQRYTLCAQRIGQLMVAGQANLIRQEVDLFQQGRAAMRSFGSIVGKS